MTATLRVPPPLESELDGLERGLVFAASPVADDWEAVEAELTEAFGLSRQAFADQQPIVYVVEHDDLLGRRGAGRAMVATGLLSAARTAAFEGRKPEIPVNVIAVAPDTPPSVTARWVRTLLDPAGPTGELIRLDPSHLGKALP